MIIELVIGSVSILFCILCYIIFNLYRKNIMYEEAVAQYYNWYDRFDEQVNYMISTLREIDSKGTFESDDEVGTFFKTLDTLVSELAEVREEYNG